MTSDINQFVQSCDAIIDFSAPALSLEMAAKCAEFKKVLVCGTTGFSEGEKQKFASYAKDTPIIWSSNMSLGVNLLMNLAEKVAGILRDDFDVEIVEMHHRNKVDAPSGTALSLGAAVAKGRGVDLEKVGTTTRSGKEAKRIKGEIGFATLRGGDVIGDHSVVFAGDGERIELTHKASNRDIFAKGAVRAAIWGSAKQPGFYSMRDVLA
jgi:4-hydroxy-tetrahydrodipicolinate reductase